ncbi:MAG: Outer rane receptor protein, partial [Bacteroidetes bacterium]|nr:Outer rane receptor protein [Bacteroidota bacterium]
MKLRSVLICLMVASQAFAGTNGTLEGTVKDSRTGESLPGVNVLILGIQRGAATDTSGFFIIQNIRAGRYDVRVTHVGYRPSLLKSVSVNADLRTRLT